MTVKNIDESEITITDFRESLDKIDNTQLALEILENLQKLDNQHADKVAVIAKLEKQITDLQATNNKLFAQVNTDIKKQTIDNSTDYTNINPTLSDILLNI